MKNVQLIQFMNLNRCQFANLPYCLRRIPRKLPTLMTATMMTIDDDNESKDISSLVIMGTFGIETICTWTSLTMSH
jgi:hypothetical protein